MRDVTLVTPTADQPTGMGLCQRWMLSQTAWERVARWVVVDDGVEPVGLHGPRIEHIRREREPDCTPEQSLCRNMLTALDRTKTEYVICVEHDDLYFPRHLETLLGYLGKSDTILAGDDEQRYYNVATRQWQVYDNWRGGSLYTTGMRRELLPVFRDALERCEKASLKGVDASLWNLAPGHRSETFQKRHAVGIKGLPGRKGIGMGHRPDESWHDDPDLSKLREWAGDYADVYAPFYQHEEAA